MSRQTPNRKWVTDQFLADYFGVHRLTVWKWAREGKIPQPRKLGNRCSRWDLADTERHLGLTPESAA